MRSPCPQLDAIDAITRDPHRGSAESRKELEADRRRRADEHDDARDRDLSPDPDRPRDLDELRERLSRRLDLKLRGKWMRAEPVAALYEQGRVKHVGAFPELEDELCDFARSGLSSGKSPDRMDALVWAVASLALERRGDGPRIRVV